MNDFPRPAAFTDGELRSIATPVLAHRRRTGTDARPARFDRARSTETLSDVRTELIPEQSTSPNSNNPITVNDLVLTFLDSV